MISITRRLAATGVNAARHKRPFQVKLIGFNDFHGNLQSPGTFGQNTSIPTALRPAVGGAGIPGAYVQRLKAQNPHNVVVGAGDFIGATPLVSALFFDEPAVETLNRIGVDFNSVGNHEFDKGSAELLRLQRGGCKETGGVRDPQQLPGRAGGHTRAVRRRQIQMAVSQRFLDCQEQAAAAAVRHQDPSTACAWPSSA